MKEIILCLATLVAVSPAQTDPQLARAQVSTYGHGCGDQGEPAFPAYISIQGLPSLGQTYTVGYTAPRWVTLPHYQNKIILVTGFSRTVARNGVPLPFYLDRVYYMMGGYDCYVLCSDEIIISFNGGIAGYPIQVPNDRRLLGMTLYHQWYLWNWVGGGIIFYYWLVTNGAMLRIGY